tara:strand:- start:7301 stop:7549 length:249 start_codon:yes stop_codon:yes gene_type:complete
MDILKILSFVIHPVMTLRPTDQLLAPAVGVPHHHRRKKMRMGAGISPQAQIVLVAPLCGPMNPPLTHHHRLSYHWMEQVCFH